MKFNNYLMGVLLVLLSANSFAADTSDISNKAHNLKTVGQAEMRWLMFPLYRVTLKTSDGQYQENRYPQSLDILYRRNIDKQDLLTATDGEWKRLGIPSAKRQEWLRQLANLWPSIKRGDKLSFQVNSQGHNYFVHNGKKLGGIVDKQFGESFLAIWLSPKTSRPAIRRQLIS